MLALGLALRQPGDQRQWSLPAEARELLEPLGPSADLVAALTEVAANEALLGRSEAALRIADQALGLAEELGFPRPARALGYRAMARVNLGDTGGLEDFREAIVLATEAGQGREVALLHNNMGALLAGVEGPAACLEEFREGIAFAGGRGLTEMHDGMTTGLVDVLVDTGELDEAISIAEGIDGRLEAAGNVFDLADSRAGSDTGLTLRGQAAQAAGVLDWLEGAAVEIGNHG